MASFDEMVNQAYARYQTGDSAGASAICQQLVGIQRSAQVDYLLGVIALEAGQREKARGLILRAVEWAPDQAVYQNALGELEMELGMGELAAKRMREAIRLRPSYERAHNSLGRLHHSAGEIDEARRCFAEAVRLNPRYATAHNNLGAVLQAQGDFLVAVPLFQQALAVQPNYPEAYFNLGNALLSQGDPGAARLHYMQAVRLRPGYFRAHHGLGRALETLGEYHAALECYAEAVRIQPDFAEGYDSLGSLLLLKPDWEAARIVLERALALKPDNSEVFARLCFTRELLCDWQNREGDLARLWEEASRQIEAGKPSPVGPFTALTLPWSPRQLQAIARSHADAFVREAARSPAEPLPTSVPHEGRLRIGYLSADFRDHAVSHQMQAIFGLHNRRGFEVFAYSLGRDDGSEYRQRIVRDCDHFHDLRNCSLAESLAIIRKDRIHVLIDLQGHTGSARLSLLAARPAPVQVHYLGFPGTLGAKGFVDYLMSDPVVTPPGCWDAYDECLVTLPDSFMPTDGVQPIADLPGTRREHDLPDNAVVFCVFNGSYKIEPIVFDCWMRILKRLPGSVLWLTSMIEPIVKNLRREAEQRGVSGERLIFARRVPEKAGHLARHALADLFLDSWIYNAHTTACDALLAGLPVLTCPGETFASRVCASLLSAIGLPELIAANREEYESLAIQLGEDREKLRQLRATLIEHRTTYPLFDTARLVRYLEQAYRMMWDLHVSGQPPRPLVVSSS